MIIEREKIGYMLYQIVLRPQVEHFTLKCWFLAWRRALENFDCYPKMGSTKKFNTFLEPSAREECFLCVLKKLKIKRNSK